MHAFLNNPIENQVKSLELRLALLVSRKNLAMPQEIISVFKKELPNNPVLNRVYMGKTKTSLSTSIKSNFILMHEI
jgi:hypothetical protein